MSQEPASSEYSWRSRRAEDGVQSATESLAAHPRRSPHLKLAGVRVVSCTSVVDPQKPPTPYGDGGGALTIRG